MEIKGLYDALGLKQEDVDALRELRVQTAAQRLMFFTKIVATGGNLHKVDRPATTKRRKANKVARKSRRVNASRAK